MDGLPEMFHTPDFDALVLEAEAVHYSEDSQILLDNTLPEMIAYYSTDAVLA